jgi:hypothetical protein
MKNGYVILYIFTPAKHGKMTIIDNHRWIKYFGEGVGPM